jgi:hypothetical protein
VQNREDIQLNRWRALGPRPGVEATQIWEEILFSPRYLCQREPVQLAMLFEAKTLLPQQLSRKHSAHWQAGGW